MNAISLKFKFEKDLTFASGSDEDFVEKFMKLEVLNYFALFSLFFWNKYSIFEFNKFIMSSCMKIEPKIHRILNKNPGNNLESCWCKI